MNNELHAMLVSGAVIAALSFIVFPAAAETPLAREMGKKWGDRCAPSGHATTCCYTQRNGESACKGLEKERTGSPVVRNCDDAEKICQTMVRSAAEAKKAEDEKKKKAEEAKKTEDKQGSGQQKQPPDLRLKSQEALEREIDAAAKDLDEVGRDLDGLNPKDPQAGQKAQALYDRLRKDEEIIARVRSILGQPTSPIQRTDEHWTRLEQKSKDIKGKFQKVCSPTGDVTAGDDAGSKVPRQTNIDPSTRGKHIVGCKFNINLGN